MRLADPATWLSIRVEGGFMSVERQPTYRPVQGAVADDYLADGDCPQLCADAIAQTAPARLLRPYPKQRNPIMPAPQSGQTKLRIAEIKIMPVLQRGQTQPYSLSLLWRFPAECTEP